VEQKSVAKSIVGQVVIWGLLLAGAVLLVWGLRVSATTGHVGIFPGVLIALVGGVFIVLSGYCYYVVKFRGSAGKKAFAVHLAVLIGTGLGSMLLARLLAR